jgi:hypothetical protein
MLNPPIPPMPPPPNIDAKGFAFCPPDAPEPPELPEFWVVEAPALVDPPVLAPAPSAVAPPGGVVLAGVDVVLVAGFFGVFFLARPFTSKMVSLDLISVERGQCNQVAVVN